MGKFCLRLGLGLALAMSALGPALAACKVEPSLGLLPADEERLGNLDKTRLKGLAAALTEPSQTNREVISGLFVAGLTPLDAILPGEYRCRTIKLGGISAALVYDFFQCAISEDGENYAIEKTTGSQNFSGSLIGSGDSFVYRGALNYANEGPIAYGARAERNQVGCLVGKGDGEGYLLELPSPAFESVHDIIELVPVRRGH